MGQLTWWLMDSTLSAEGGALDENLALYGGAVFSQDSDFAFDGTSFSNNSAEQTGGALYMQDSIGAINGGVFRNNVATYAGAIYAEDSAVAL